ncbi:uncharacterized protein LOC100574766 [Acyrthosiphon pisum]|nr:uncharacterized protein LOC100574766 [Acyrthosiphon pisum]|eukprot:XP_003247461.2 PREDICTED: uncharacterized protein LOC100574766 [Acyrthosiphon pisum]
MYSAVYKATLKTVPGAFFLLGGALTAPAALIFLWMYNEHKKERREKEAEIRDEEKKSEALKKKNSLDFRISSHDFDLKTILDRRTQTHRGSGQFSSLGLDNIAFQMEEGTTKGK